MKRSHGESVLDMVRPTETGPEAVRSRVLDAYLALNRTCESAMPAIARSHHRLLEACEHVTRPVP